MAGKPQTSGKNTGNPRSDARHVVNPKNSGDPRTAARSAVDPSTTGSNVVDPMGTVFDTASSGYNAGMGALGASLTPGMFSATMNSYLNPYKSEVVDNTLRELREEQLRDLNMIKGDAEAAGAYGGARHGLVEAKSLEEYGETRADTVASLNKAGFDSAVGFGLNRINQVQGGAGSLISGAPTGVNMGSQVLSGQLAVGDMQRGLNQQIMDQATGQFDSYINYPQTALGTALAGIQGNPLSGNQTRVSKYKPGLFDYLSLGAGLGSSYLAGPRTPGSGK